MSSGLRIGLFGTFDVENYGSLLFPRLFEREIRQRLPDAQVRAFSPFGPAHPVAMNRGWSPEALGLWTRERLRELASELDLVAVGGGGIIHTRDELLATAYGVDPLELRLRRPSDFFLEYPAVWHAVGIPFDLDPHEARVVRATRRPYIAVRDERSQARLAAVGVEDEVEMVPDPAFLLDRLFPPRVLDSARDSLRARGDYPAEGRPLILQGSAALLDHVDALAAAIRNRPEDVVLIETGRCHGDDRFAEAMLSRLERRVFRVDGGSSLEDMGAAIAGAAGYAGSSMHGAITALVYGVPTLILDLGGCNCSKLAGLAEVVGRDDIRVTEVPHVLDPPPPPDVGHLGARVDEHHDRIAALAIERRTVPEAVTLSGATFELTRRRLLEERRRYADLVDDVGAERDQARAELAEAKRYIASLEAALGEKESELRKAQRQLSEHQVPGEPPAGLRAVLEAFTRRPR